MKHQPYAATDGRRIGKDSMARRLKQVEDVIAGRRRYALIPGDCLDIDASFRIASSIAARSTRPTG